MLRPNDRQGFYQIGMKRGNQVWGWCRWQRIRAVADQDKKSRRGLKRGTARLQERSRSRVLGSLCCVCSRSVRAAYNEAKAVKLVDWSSVDKAAGREMDVSCYTAQSPSTNHRVPDGYQFPSSLRLDRLPPRSRYAKGGARLSDLC